MVNPLFGENCPAAAGRCVRYSPLQLLYTPTTTTTTAAGRCVRYSQGPAAANSTKTQHFGVCHTSTTITIHTIYCNLLLNLDNTHFNRSRCYTANLTKHNIFAVTLAYLCFSWCTSSKSCQLNTILDHIIATGPLIFN